MIHTCDLSPERLANLWKPMSGQPTLGVKGQPMKDPVSRKQGEQQLRLIFPQQGHTDTQTCMLMHTHGHVLVHNALAQACTYTCTHTCTHISTRRSPQQNLFFHNLETKGSSGPRSPIQHCPESCLGSSSITACHQPWLCLEFLTLHSSLYPIVT